MIENTEVLNHIYSLCQAAETGTFFITTTENRACHLIIDNGRITALSYGPLRGEQVVAQLPQIKIERFSFKAKIKMPLAGRSFVEDDYDVLGALAIIPNQLMGRK
ncbi:hypothetical protein [Methylophaga sp. OBS4]|uniref:hypothetical protein n=1 Tax=Methylophaga sp. OBS4 TaxID=2991935 RepID=UPI002256DB1C|nr:hypothetical protein [Methylophaga sp. OBS4]MCX4186830.1 hypothetical protein [Methylophaga sp. OBS4]